MMFFFPLRFIPTPLCLTTGRKIPALLPLVLLTLVVVVLRSVQWDFTGDLNCTRILLDENYATLVERWKPHKTWTERELLGLVESGCQNLQEHFFFQSKPLSKEEQRFPLAFVFIVYRNPEQVLRLLEAVYWPQNLYCFTYDMKSAPGFKKFIENLAGCFPNVLMAEVHETIFWGTIQVLRAAVNCMQVLNSHPNKWRYVQILSGNDIPLKTNWEMVKIFKTLNGANDAELREGPTGWYTYHAEYFEKDVAPPNHYNKKWMVGMAEGQFYIDHDIPKSPPPGNLTIYKGSFAAAMTRAFIHFVLTDPVPKEYLDWLKDTVIPDEHYWSTLIHNTHIGAPGAFPGSCLSAYKDPHWKPWISRYQAWPGEQECKGRWERGSCVFGVGDLETMVTLPHLIAHKFHLSFQPTAYFCLLRWHHNATSGPVRIDTLNLDYYLSLPAVKFQNRPKGLEFECT